MNFRFKGLSLIVLQDCSIMFIAYIICILLFIIYIFIIKLHVNTWLSCVVVFGGQYEAADAYIRHHRYRVDVMRVREEAEE